MREKIISEIKRVAELNGGIAPGMKSFLDYTGITRSDWYGKIWTKWSDALLEAGFEPNALRAKSDPAYLLEKLVAPVRHFKRFPTSGEMRLFKHQVDKTFPWPTVFFENFISVSAMIAAFREWASAKVEYQDVLEFLPKEASQKGKIFSKAKQSGDGSVYLIRSGEFFKIGRSDELERRVKQITIALPDKAILEHTISTDDPPGIEAYWHRRFSDKRANGEWFRLTPNDLKAFKRRKFQ